MSEESKISFSSNGLGVSLKTQFGHLSFTSDEFSYYQNLYRIIDCDNEGNISITNAFFYLLLVRSNISQEVLEKLLAVACGIPLHLPTPSTQRRSFEEKDQQRLTNEVNSLSLSVPVEAVSSGKEGKKSQKSKNKKASVTPPPPPPPSEPTPSSSSSLTSQPGTAEKISFSQWLVLCKLLAYFQETQRLPSEKVFKSLHSSPSSSTINSAVKLSLVDFLFGTVRDEWALGRLWLEFKVRVVGWQVYGEDYSSQHTKYRIATRCSLQQELPFLLPGKAESTAPSIEKKRDEEVDVSTEPLPVEMNISVERRYSEFESFSQILHKCYRGFILPPLPAKNWAGSNTSQDLLKQRAVEFQMFLQHLAEHPQLSRSYELLCFLTTSPNGFKAFVDVYQHNFTHTHFDNASHADPSSYTSSTSPTSSASPGTSLGNNNNSGSAVSKLLQDSTSLLTNGASNLFSSASALWGNISKTVSTMASPIIGNPSPALLPSHHLAYQHLLNNSPEDTTLFSKTSAQLEHSAAIAKAYDKLLHAEEGRMTELSKLSGCFKTTSELESQADLVRTLQLAHDKMTQVARIEQETLQRLTGEVAMPLGYLARFTESFRITAQNRHAVQDQLILAHKEELERKKKLELLLSQTRAMPSSSSSSSTPLISSGAWRQPASQQPMIRSGYPEESQGHAISYSFEEMKQREEEANLARLSLVEAENLVEQRKLEESAITQEMHKESLRIGQTQRKNVLIHLIALTKQRIQETRQSTEYWLALKEALEK